MVNSFLIYIGAYPIDQVLFPVIRINWAFTGYQLENHHTKAVDVTLFIHSKGVRILCIKRIRIVYLQFSKSYWNWMTEY
ncbi:hypothetical protein OIU79_020704 [Salix purpurea]|uniref:Uncharacterized protein n=1 Tax=Salix purpurea TaxID=77065 RepID=A0A9Q0WM88_SALPP|nr:hypothetical protein OIU79_020704 [Salix purpurea]